MTWIVRSDGWSSGVPDTTRHSTKLGALWFTWIGNRDSRKRGIAVRYRLLGRA